MTNNFPHLTHRTKVFRSDQVSGDFWAIVGFELDWTRLEVVLSPAHPWHYYVVVTRGNWRPDWPEATGFCCDDRRLAYDYILNYEENRLCLSR